MMYNPEIGTLINQNLKMDLEVGVLVKAFYVTGDSALLDQAAAIQNEIAKNHMTIERMRGEQ